MHVAVYPSKIEVTNCAVAECELLWYKSPKSEVAPPLADSDLWIPAGSGFCLTTCNDDIGRWLKLECVPRVKERTGSKESVVSTQVVEAGPGHCPFETRHNFTRHRVPHSGY